MRPAWVCYIVPYDPHLVTACLFSCRPPEKAHSWPTPCTCFTCFSTMEQDSKATTPAGKITSSSAKDSAVASRIRSCDTANGFDAWHCDALRVQPSSCRSFTLLPTSSCTRSIASSASVSASSSPSLCSPSPELKMVVRGAFRVKQATGGYSPVLARSLGAWPCTTACISFSTACKGGKTVKPQDWDQYQFATLL